MIAMICGGSASNSSSPTFRPQEGYLLTGTLTGKFGSGVYCPLMSGYMDMEPDFEEDYSGDCSKKCVKVRITKLN